MTGAEKGMTSVAQFAGLALMMAIGGLMPANGFAEPVDTRALIEQALDEPARITLDNIPLGQAIRVVTEQTGVKIVMPPEVMAMVPHGAGTIVREVEIANMSLREALVELFSPLGMTCQLRDTFLAVVPKPPLVSLGRPPTWEELATLSDLARLSIGTDSKAEAVLKSRVQFQIPVREAWSVLAGALRGVGAGPGDEVLSIACHNLGWAWSLSGDRIVVTTREQVFRRQLRRPISLRKNSRPLFEVLQAIGKLAGVTLRAEPGTLDALPLAVQRNFSVNVRNQPAEKVLDSIAAYTGLAYVITPEGIVFFRTQMEADAPARLTQPKPPAQPRMNPPRGDIDSQTDPVVARITVPLEDGRTAEWLIRRSELPEDLRIIRQRDLAELLEAARRYAREVP